MDDLIKLKEELIAICEAEISNKRKVLESIMSDAQQSANNETKSTAGDKHDTARAMAHLEQEKNAQQLNAIKELERGVAELKKVKQLQQVDFGALVITNSIYYLIGLGLGKLVVDNNTIYSISPVSPIAIKLRGLKAGDKLNFNGNNIFIKSII